jgi:hypothetical protein
VKHLGELARLGRLTGALSRAFLRLFHWWFRLWCECVQEHSRGRQRIGLTSCLCSRLLAFFCHPGLALVTTSYVRRLHFSG